MAEDKSVHGPRTLLACCSMPPSTQVMVIVPGVPPSAMLRVGRRTTTRKLQLLVLPQASVATAVTRLVVSRLKKLPEGGVEVTVTELQVSVAVTDQLTGTLVLHVMTRMLLGHVIVGGAVSTTVTSR